jgi:hypothetical protein
VLITFLGHFALQTVVSEQNDRSTFLDAIVISDGRAAVAVMRIALSFIGRNVIVTLHLLLFQAEPSCARIAIRVRASAVAETDENARPSHTANMMWLRTMFGLFHIGISAALKPVFMRLQVA